MLGLERYIIERLSPRMLKSINQAISDIQEKLDSVNEELCAASGGFIGICVRRRIHDFLIDIMDELVEVRELGTVSLEEVENTILDIDEQLDALEQIIAKGEGRPVITAINTRHRSVLLGERCKLGEVKFNLLEKKAAGKLDVAKEG